MTIGWAVAGCAAILVVPGVILAGCAVDRLPDAGMASAGQPTEGVRPWAWPDRALSFRLGGGRRQAVGAYLDASGRLVVGGGRRLALGHDELDAIQGWLRDPDALGREADRLNCDPGRDESNIEVTFARAGALPQPYLFCVDSLPGDSTAARLKEIAEQMR